MPTFAFKIIASFPLQESDFKKIRDLVAAAETEAALETLVKMLSKDGEDKDFLDDCLKIQAQQFQLKQDEIRNILSASKNGTTPKPHQPSPF